MFNAFGDAVNHIVCSTFGSQAETEEKESEEGDLAIKKDNNETTKCDRDYSALEAAESIAESASKRAEMKRKSWAKLMRQVDIGISNNYFIS